MTVVIIDYGTGNLASVKNALSMIDIDADIISDPHSLKEATHIILPGVGAFHKGMEGLEKGGFVEVLKEEVMGRKKKLLGICLGMQLLASKGFEHGECDGLGFISGSVIKIETKKSKARLPHMGWNDVKLCGNHTITAGLSDPIFYFVHSFHLLADNEEVIAGVADYGDGEIVSIVESDNVFGTQFHPEKSYTDGLQIFKNFLAK
jgi:imidazole glycerol-phosphate synthase subunit HisH